MGQNVVTGGETKIARVDHQRARIAAGGTAPAARRFEADVDGLRIILGVAHEDEAERRTCLTALAVRELVPLFRKKPEPKPSPRVGIEWCPARKIRQSAPFDKAPPRSLSHRWRHSPRPVTCIAGAQQAKDWCLEAGTSPPRL